MSGRNVFLTGGAGVGKSETTKAIVAALEVQGKRVARTATTGIAASLIGGRSLMSFYRLIVPCMIARDPEKAVKHVMKTRDGPGNLRNTDTLIVDEVSMLEGGDLERYDYVARRVRGGDRPFGGLQIILVGDFFQLPPVKRKQWAFHSASWAALQFSTHELSRVYRQENRADVELLQRMRKDELNGDDKQRLLNHPVPQNPDATYLFACNDKVDEVNEEQLDRLQGDICEMKSIDSASHDKFKECLAPRTLSLKVGAKVICLKNLDPDHPDVPIMNGTRGRVVRFDAGEVPTPFSSFARTSKRMLRLHLSPRADTRRAAAGEQRASTGGCVRFQWQDARVHIRQA